MVLGVTHNTNTHTSHIKSVLFIVGLLTLFKTVAWSSDTSSNCYSFYNELTYIINFIKETPIIGVYLVVPLSFIIRLIAVIGTICTLLSTIGKAFIFILKIINKFKPIPKVIQVSEVINDFISYFSIYNVRKK